MGPWVSSHAEDAVYVLYGLSHEITLRLAGKYKDRKGFELVGLCRLFHIVDGKEVDDDILGGGKVTWVGKPR